MKKVIFFFLLSLATMPLQLTAQVNPQKGYVITNEGDTSRSTRDAERYGWIMGYNNANFNNKMDNLLR